MSVGGVQSNNGVFTITGINGTTQQVDLGTLMMMLKIDQTSNLDEQLAVQLGEIQERNNLITQLTEFLSACRTYKNGTPLQKQGLLAEAKENPKTNAIQLRFAITGFEESYKTLKEYATYFGLSWSAVGKDDAGQNGWDANINNIKSKLDTLNNDSQMANIKLQNLLEKRNNAFDMATQAMSSNNDSVASTIRNL